MKTSKLLFLILFLTSRLYSQKSAAPSNAHNGFQFSAYMGGVVGKVETLSSTSGENVIFRGSTAHVMFHLGYAIKDFAFGFAFGTNSMTLESGTVNGKTYKALPNYGISYGLTGIYFSKYFMPINIFTSLELGAGKFNFDDLNTSTYNSTNNSFDTDRALSWNLRVGKEFLIGKKKKWGLGGYMNVGGLKCKGLPPDNIITFKANPIGGGLSISYH